MSHIGKRVRICREAISHAPSLPDTFALFGLWYHNGTEKDGEEVVS
jgi:hypothetical protein